MKSSFGNLDKKVPQSTKFAHVASRTDSGASASKQAVITTSAARKRRDEIFKRIRAATLVRLLQELGEGIQSESVFSMGPGSDRGGSSAHSTHASQAGRTKAGSAATFSSVGPVLSVIDNDTTVDHERDLVLLDLRELDEFERCHVPLAIPYPSCLVNRDSFPATVHQCKRDPSKLLVVYHTDDQATAGMATLLVQKGWDNVHALSGGFEEMARHYPEVLEGDLPARPETLSGNSTLSRPTRTGSSSRTGSSARAGSSARTGSSARAGSSTRTGSSVRTGSASAIGRLRP